MSYPKSLSNSLFWKLPNLDKTVKKLSSLPVGWWVTKEDREYIVDVVGSNWIYELDQTNVSCEIEVDEETFPDCNFDLTSDDLFNCDLKSTIFIGDFSNELISATLFVKIYGKMTKAIDLELE